MSVDPGVKFFRGNSPMQTSVSRPTTPAVSLGRLSKGYSSDLKHRRVKSWDWVTAPVKALTVVYLCHGLGSNVLFYSRTVQHTPRKTP